MGALLRALLPFSFALASARAREILLSSTHKNLASKLKCNARDTDMRANQPKMQVYNHTLTRNVVLREIVHASNQV